MFYASSLSLKLLKRRQSSKSAENKYTRIVEEDLSLIVDAKSAQYFKLKDIEKSSLDLSYCDLKPTREFTRTLST